jgi:cadmium resistance protein CadD (predicted permease)
MLIAAMPVQTVLETSTSLALGAGGVLATNLENVVIALAAFCGRMSVSALRARFMAGLFALLGFSWIAGSAAGLMPPHYLGYLGLIPVLLGLHELYQGGRQRAKDRGSRPLRRFTRPVAAVALLMIASGTDTVAVFTPLIAESETTDRLMQAVGYLVTGALLAWFCAHACEHPSLARPIERHGARVAPLLMIGIGGYILLNTATDTLP